MAEGWTALVLMPAVSLITSSQCSRITVSWIGFPMMGARPLNWPGLPKHARRSIREVSQARGEHEAL